MAAVARLPIVGVIGSGSDYHEDLAVPLGRWLATQNVHLLTGAGKGVMAAVSRAFAETPNRKGLVLGIVPSGSEDEPHVPKVGYPSDWVEVPIFTHLHLSGTAGQDPRSRNHLVVLTGRVLVALPGGPGTASEIRLALRYSKPVIAYLKGRDDIADLPNEVRSTGDFGEVKTFVSEAIAGRGEPWQRASR